MEAVLLPPILPLLPLRNQVLLPSAYARLQLPKNKKSYSLVESFWAASSNELFVVAAPVINGAAETSQEQAVDVGHIPFSSLSQVATAARVLQVSKLVQAEEWVVLLEGVCRVTLDALSSRTPDSFDTVVVQQLEQRSAAPPPQSRSDSRPTSNGPPGPPKAPDKQLAELGRQLKSSTRGLLQGLARGMRLPPSQRLLEMLERVPPAQAADIVAAALAVGFQDRLSVLQTVEPRARVRLALGLVASAQEALQNGGGGPIKGGPVSLDPLQVATSSRRSPMKLGSSGDEADDSDGLLERLTAAQLPPDVMKSAMKELQRLRAGGDHQPGSANIRAYLELMADLPWAKFSLGAGGQDGTGAQPPPISLKAARQLLDEGHYGLDKLKERVVEYLAVLRLRGPSGPAPVLCFIGPPGVGKTSIARGIAQVLGRPFVRIALGGVRDESEVRGHRRTYVGAMPGRILQGIRRAGVRDCVVLLDELDKLGRDAVRGDPAAALLEVLDPEQNSGFVDTFLGQPFDLSRITFLATANKASDIPPALLDRLEVVSVPGYSREEKVAIAQRHLLPRMLQDHGLPASSLQCSDSVMDFVADKYTREAGVRNLARCLAAVCRHVAVSIVNLRDDSGGGDDPNRMPLEYPEALPEEEAAVRAASRAPPSTAPPPMLRAQGASSPSPSPTTQVAAWRQHLQTPAPGAVAAVSHPHPSVSANASASTPQQAGARCAIEPQQAGRGSLVGARGASAAPHLMDLHSAWPGGSLQAAACSGTGWQAAAPSARPSERRAGPAPHAPQPATTTSSSVAPSRTPAAATAMVPAAAAAAGGIGASKGVPQEPRRPAAATNAPPPDGRLQNPRWGGPALGVRRQRTSGGGSAVIGGGPHGPPYPPDLLDAGPTFGSPVVLTEELVELVLGPPRFLANEAAERLSCPGNVAGLVWTAAGGSLQFVECCCVGIAPPERCGQLILTGQAGEVLQESAQIALSWVRSHSAELGLEGPFAFRAAAPPQTLGALTLAPTPQPVAVGAGGSSTAAARQLLRMGGMVAPEDAVDEEGEEAGRYPGGLRSGRPGQRFQSSPATSWDVHIHLPAGAVPKDGPSAGVTLAVALISLFIGRCVRADTALTGELTLHGMVLPVGGVKEKLLAARHAGLTRVVVPHRNLRDVVADVPEVVRSQLEILPARTLPDVLRHMFDPPLMLMPQPRL